MKGTGVAIDDYEARLTGNTGHSASLTGLKPCTEYAFIVTAENPGGESGASYVTRLCTAPSTPAQAPTLSCSGDTVTVTWTEFAPSEMPKWWVYCMPGSEDFDLDDTGVLWFDTVAGSQTVDIPLGSDGWYAFKIRAINPYSVASDLGPFATIEADSQH